MNSIPRVLARLIPVAAIAALAGCVAVPVGYDGGGGYGYAPAPQVYVPGPVIVAPVYRGPSYGYGHGYRPYHGGWR